MSTNNNRQVTLVMTVIAALTALFTITSVSFAAGGEGTRRPTVCVDGYVINHREQPVDGTRFDPQLRIYAFAVRASDEAASLPDLEVEVQTLDALEMLSAQSLEADAETEADGMLRRTVATVGSDGYYQFPKLRAGYHYMFALPLPTDWDSIVPEAPRGGIAWTGWTKLNEKEGCYDVLFKIRRWFDVTVLKWEELRDGTVQPGEGWTMTATPQGDPWAIKQSGNTVLNPNGADARVVLPLTPGKWLIAETVKSGWTPITPASVTITLDQYAPPGATDPVVFKNLEPVCYATLTVEKWGWGTNKEGKRVWLGPLAGWHITLSRPDGVMAPVTLATDGTGKVIFKNLKPGVYHVKETVQPGWVAISPNPQQVIIRDCEHARVLFENLEVVGKLQISGTKFFRAWVPPYQGKTVGLSGWGITATLKGTSPAVFVTTVTDALGNYRFSEATLEAAGMAIPGATITVCEEERFHWIPVSPVCVDVRFPYPVPVDYKGAVVNFTNVQDPPLPGASTTSAASAGASCATTYQIQPGDTLSGIAAGHGVTMQAIVQANGISNPNYVQAGKVLCIR
jgi:hypothetical protein